MADQTILIKNHKPCAHCYHSHSTLLIQIIVNQYISLMNNQNQSQRQPRYSSSLSQLIGISFIAAQILLIIMGFSYLLTISTLTYIFNIFLAIYSTCKVYWLTMIVWFIILSLPGHIKLKLKNQLNLIYQSIAHPKRKCPLNCNQGGYDLVCKYCSFAYHENCLAKAGLPLICTNPPCLSQLSQQRQQNLLQIIVRHKRYAFYCSLIFIGFGLAPSLKRAFHYFYPLSNEL